VGDSRTFDYGYDNVGNRNWTKRDGGTGDVFGYDLNDQVTVTKLNITNPDTTAPGSPTITYDANGNRISFAPYGATDSYTTNNLNQYSTRNSTSATYDLNGNLTTGVDGSTYTYDAQNRLLSATKSGTTETFQYDGLNRQVSRIIGAASPLYNVYDGWDLIGEYNLGATAPLNAYLNGAGGLVKLLTASSSFYYYQDASGCTSHLSDSTGHLVEWYRYDLQGTPVFYDSINNQRSTSSYGIRHLFTGQQWYSELGLYDLRNRFYSPDVGRFLQADPSGFSGDATNLYRYCGNNPLTGADPWGLWTFQIGVAVNFHFGPVSGSWNRGIAFDGNGNFAGFNTVFGGVGAGARFSGGFTFAASNWDTVFDLARDYKVINGGGGAGASGTGQVFWGQNEKKDKLVYGVGTTIGAGLGGGGSGGGSWTNIYPLWSPSSSSANPPPGGTTYVDRSDGISVLERVTVTGQEVPNWGSAGLPVPMPGEALGGINNIPALGPDAVFGTDVPAGQIGLILGGLPSGNTGWGALGQKPLIL